MDIIGRQFKANHKLHAGTQDVSVAQQGAPGASGHSRGMDDDEPVI